MTTRLLHIRSPLPADRLPHLLASLEGVRVDIAASMTEAIAWLRSAACDAVLATFPMTDWSPEEVIEEVQRADAVAPVVIHQRAGLLSEAVRLTKLGAYDYCDDSITRRELAELLERASRHASEQRTALPAAGRGGEPWRRFLVGESREMQAVLQVVRLIGARRSTVLITGETGTGKEMVARAIHMASPRANMPLVAVNCSALPENLLEAELFGHVKGAFTGAVNSRVGRFEQANHGTIFLDEIGDMPLDLQAKLLRVLQEREFQRLGSSETIRVDVRVLAASNVNLVERVREGKFREDLYYRLNVVPLPLPPLRERQRDIPILVHHFIDKICRQEELPPRRISDEALRRLARFDWPGNVRQLENAVEMAIALSGDRLELRPGDFPLPSVAALKPVRAGAAPVVAVPDDGLDFEQTVGRIERAILEQAMRKTGGNKKQAAEMLNLKRTTFAAKLRSLEAAVSGGGDTLAKVCAAN